MNEVVVMCIYNEETIFMIHFPSSDDIKIKTCVAHLHKTEDTSNFLIHEV
jgi:hypothetical protein